MTSSSDATPPVPTVTDVPCDLCGRPTGMLVENYKPNFGEITMHQACYDRLDKLSAKLLDGAQFA